jgi:uncharacterized protein YbjT (DUF2867 family)
MPKRFVVAGATGRVGSVVARELLSRGNHVRALIRDPAAAGRVDPRAEPVPVPLDDRPALARALGGAEAFFTLLPETVPPDDFRGRRRRMADALAGAVQDADVPRAVILSAIAAGVAEGNGPARELRYLEDAFRSGRAVVTAVRPTYFQENVAAMADVARASGIYPSFMPAADAAFPTAATRDVGVVAAERMQAAEARTETLDVLGPAYSVRQMAERLARAVGRDVRVVDIPAGRHVAALVEAGVPEPIAEVYAEMFAGIAAGIMVPRGDRVVTVATTLEQTLRDALARSAA